MSKTGRNIQSTYSGLTTEQERALFIIGSISPQRSYYIDPNKYEPLMPKISKQTISALERKGLIGSSPMGSVMVSTLGWGVYFIIVQKLAHGTKTFPERKTK
jgi:hypothetical protein